MKNTRLRLALSVAVLGLWGCSDDSGPAGPAGPQASGRIETGLLGSWVEYPAAFAGPDTLIFAENRIQTPFFSAVGTLFTAKDGLVKGGPSMTTYGEYLRVDDTLYFDALLGDAPNGVDKTTADRYLKISP